MESVNHFSGFFFDEQKVQKNSIYLKYNLTIFKSLLSLLINKIIKFSEKKLADPKLLNL